MLTEKSIRMLQLLDKQVSTCRKCELHSNGHAIPYWTKYSKYVMIGEAPGFHEVRKQTPFVGKAGNILTLTLAELGFSPSDFLIVNSVQCRPVTGNRNAKPTDEQLEKCNDYVRKYIKIVDPEKILCLGNYAKSFFTGDRYGVIRQRGEFKEFSLKGGRKYPVLITVHPAYCIYNDDGASMLREDLKLFRDTEFERESDWLFTEDEFNI